MTSEGVVFVGEGKGEGAKEVGSRESIEASAERWTVPIGSNVIEYGLKSLVW